MGGDDRDDGIQGRESVRNIKGNAQPMTRVGYDRYWQPYDIEAANWIVESMTEEGRDLASVCNEPADFWPNGKRYSRQTVYSWIDANPMFRQQIAYARQAYADDTFGKIMRTTDKMDNESVTVDREKIRAWQWAAKVTSPRTYGDRAVLDHTGDLSVTTQAHATLDVSGLTTDQRDALRSLLLAARRQALSDDSSHDTRPDVIDGQAIDVTPSKG